MSLFREGPEWLSVFTNEQVIQIRVHIIVRLLEHILQSCIWKRDVKTCQNKQFLKYLNFILPTRLEAWRAKITRNHQELDEFLILL